MWRLTPAQAVLVALAALAAWNAWKSSRPKWLDDVLLRTYASDHVKGATKDEKAADVALELGLPITWVEELRDLGVDDTRLENAAAAAVNYMVDVGPPSSSDPATLAAYRAAAIQAGANGG